MSKSTPLVTVVTITFNLLKAGRKDNIRQCIESVHAQDYPNVEHIVIDGASTDGTLDLLRPYEKQKWLSIYSEPDSGIYDAMNKGVAHARGEFIAFLNSDDFWHDPHGISASVEALRREHADFSFAPVYYLNGDDVREGVLDNVIGNFHTRMPCSHQSMFVHRRVFEKIGSFNTDYKSSADFDFVLRMCLSGATFVRVPLNFTSFRHTGLSSTTAAQLGDMECAVSLQRNLSPLVPSYTLEKARNHFDFFLVPKDVLKAIRRKVCPQLRRAMDSEPTSEQSGDLIRIERVPRLDRTQVIHLLFDTEPIIAEKTPLKIQRLANRLLDSLALRKDLEVFLAVPRQFERALERLYADRYAIRPNIHLYLNDEVNAKVVFSSEAETKLRRLRCPGLLLPDSACESLEAESVSNEDIRRFSDSLLEHFENQPASEKRLLRLRQGAPVGTAHTARYSFLGLPNFVVVHRSESRVVTRLFGVLPISHLERTPLHSLFHLFGLPLLGFSKRPGRIDVTLFNHIPILRLVCYDPDMAQESFAFRFQRNLLWHVPVLCHPRPTEFARLAGISEPVPTLPICFFGRDFSIRRMYTTEKAFHIRRDRYVLTKRALERLDSAFNHANGKPFFIDFAPNDATTPVYELQQGETLDFSRLPFLRNAVGFSIPEPWGCWTDGPDVRFRFRAPHAIGPLELRFAVSAALCPLNPVLRATVRLNGRVCAHWRFVAGRPLPDTSIRLSASDVPKLGIFAFDIRLHTPQSPAFLGLGTDPRRLGLAFRSLSFVAIKPHSPKCPSNRRVYSLVAQQTYFSLMNFGDDEGGLRWMLHRDASIKWNARNPTAPYRTVTIETMAFAASKAMPRTLVIYDGTGRAVARHSVTDSKWHTLSFSLPRSSIDDAERITLHLHSKSAVSPASVGLGSDERPLSFAVRSIWIVPKRMSSPS